MKKIKVLEVIYCFDYGGIRAFIMNAITHIDKTKFDIDIYAFGCSSSPFTKQVEDLGVHIYFEPENISNKHIWRFVSKLEKFMKEHGPYDVCHAHNNLISAWVLLAAKRAGIPNRLSHSHTTGHFKGGFMQRLYSSFRQLMINKLATKKLACGDLAGKTMYGMNEEFTIINNGINVERFITNNEEKVEELRTKLNIPKGVKVYANVSRLDTSKNQLFAIEVFNEIHKIEPDSLFVYGGVIPQIASQVEEVNNKINEYGLDASVRFCEPLMEVEHLYHLSTLWIYCSTFEGLPFGPIELQAAGVPCLASDIITREIDLGLGLVKFIPLTESPRHWAEIAIATEKKKISNDAIIKAFNECGFNMSESVKLLQTIYSGN